MVHFQHTCKKKTEKKLAHSSTALRWTLNKWIIYTHVPQTLQWCARSGLITKHLSQYRSEPFIVLSMITTSNAKNNIWNGKIFVYICCIRLHTYRLLIGRSFAKISKIRFCVLGLSACVKRSISELGIRNCSKFNGNCEFLWLTMYRVLGWSELNGIPLSALCRST